MARWHSCNILQIGAATRRVWQFDARKTALTLNREQTAAAGQPLPENLIAKSWTTLWQPKLNIAWLASEHVFLRVVHLPQADLAETRAMVEFQLEKLSPIHVTQMVWSLHVLPMPVETKTAALAEGQKPKEVLQTIIVVMVERNLVEEFLGKLEKDGFLADRLEVPLIDQLQNTAAASATAADARVYLDSETRSALVAWWFGGSLQSLGFLHLPADKTAAELLREQLVQMTWAGELEGWLTAAPQWHLVVTGGNEAEWQALFNTALETTVKLAPPPPLGQLAAATATRATRSEDSANILPAEYSTRYRQQLTDRLWMRGLLTVLGIYCAGVFAYFIALKVLQFQAGGVEQQKAELSTSYTNAIQLQARYQILKDRQDLKYAALNCWQTTAQLLPEGATLNGLDFRDGKKLMLTGSAGSDQAIELTRFSDAMRKAEIGGRLLFSRVDSPIYNQNPGSTTVSWSFGCEINHTEETL